LAQEEAALQNCTFAVYASEWAANSARQFVSHDKVKVLPFGANMFIEHGPDDIQEWVQSRSRQLSNRVSLLFVGIDWERKGLRTAIETVRILNDRGIAATLKVVGARPNFDLPNFVEHLGFIDKGRIEGRNLLTQLYRDSHFFILPTTAESAGVVFCEASAHALPILAYATGGVPDYVKRDVNGFALECHLGAPDFADAAEGLIKAPEQYTALAVSAYNEYVTRLNWDSSIGRLLNLFGEAIELHNPKKSAT
jgi:glycosyltransferase involved in cell wall biosynthesis